MIRELHIKMETTLNQEEFDAWGVCLMKDICGGPSTVELINSPKISEGVEALSRCVDIMFGRKKEIPTIGGQTCGAELYSIRFSGYELGVIYEQLDVLKDICSGIEHDS